MQKQYLVSAGVTPLAPRNLKRRGDEVVKIHEFSGHRGRYTVLEMFNLEVYEDVKAILKAKNVSYAGVALRDIALIELPGECADTPGLQESLAGYLNRYAKRTLRS